MNGQAWLGVALGGLLLAASAILAFSDGGLATACAIGGVVLLVLAWPARSPAPQASHGTKDWQALGTALGLQGPQAAPDGRFFLGMRADRAMPLDDGRAVYDGADGFAPGLAFTDPNAALLEAWLARDEGRLASLANLEEDLGDLGAWSGQWSDVRVTPTPDGMLLRYDGKGGAGTTPWVLLAAVARAANRNAWLKESSDHHALLAWVSA